MNGALRRAAYVAALAGGVGAVALTVFTGRRNPSLLLMLLFAGWVLAPFVALLWAHKAANSWPSLTSSVLYAVTLMVAAATLAIYGYIAFGPPRPRPAAVFLVVPLCCVLLIAVAVGAAALLSRAQSPRSIQRS